MLTLCLGNSFPSCLQTSVTSHLLIFPRESGESDRASGFLLSLLSRVWHRELCGGFREATERRLVLEDVSPIAFRKVMGLACCVGGGGATRTTGLGEVVELALLADRYEVVAVRDVLEAAAIRSLTVHSCAPLLDTRSSGASLSALSAAARAFALRHFEELAATDGFSGLGEKALALLVEADELHASAEEQRFFEALVAWMTHVPTPAPPPPFNSPPADTASLPPEPYAAVCLLLVLAAAAAAAVCLFHTLVTAAMWLLLVLAAAAAAVCLFHALGAAAVCLLLVLAAATTAVCLSHFFAAETPADGLLHVSLLSLSCRRPATDAKQP